MHQSERCKICKALKPRTRKECDFHLKQLLMEAAIRPAAPDRLVPGLSLVRSAPASVREPVLRKHSGARDPLYRRSLAPQHGVAPRQQSTSLVPLKRHKKADRRRSPQRVRPSGETLLPQRKDLTSKQQEPTPSTPVTQSELLSPARSNYPVGLDLVEELEAPSTPDTFETARDLIESTLLQPPAVRDKPPALPRQVPSRGKLALMRPCSFPDQHHSWHRSQSTSPVAPPSIARHCDTALEYRSHSPALVLWHRSMLWEI
ncbi:hypothetical protein UY3_17992 [Chelonia mydas]|uniref:Uncharacterized protein n=1 Tax=Chelonia mydas TaxID=8469 RepID=M7AIQ8_CHEMY|nr:hypothetical protein UY3_17992 [Chelonia mydas]